jgi:hypothetical protein
VKRDEIFLCSLYYPKAGYENREAEQSLDFCPLGKGKERRSFSL